MNKIFDDLATIFSKNGFSLYMIGSTSRDYLLNKEIFDYDFVVNYRSSLVVQKWNDVLALLNEKYNDGYFFSHIQWYMDGTPIEGATGPYYYVPNGNLNFGSEYCALLTRTDDGESYFTCPIIALDKQVDQMTVSPNFLPAGRHPLRFCEMGSSPCGNTGRCGTLTIQCVLEIM